LARRTGGATSSPHTTREVEDNPDHEELIRRAFSDRGAPVAPSVARHGEEALAAAGTGTPGAWRRDDVAKIDWRYNRPG
jgi:hypothetical protein